MNHFWIDIPFLHMDERSWRRTALRLQVNLVLRFLSYQSLYAALQSYWWLHVIAGCSRISEVRILETSFEAFRLLSPENCVLLQGFWTDFLLAPAQNQQTRQTWLFKIVTRGYIALHGGVFFLRVSQGWCQMMLYQITYLYHILSEKWHFPRTKLSRQSHLEQFLLSFRLQDRWAPTKTIVIWSSIHQGLYYPSILGL